MKITEKKVQGGTGRAQLANQPGKGVVKGRDRQQYTGIFGGEENGRKDSCL